MMMKIMPVVSAVCFRLSRMLRQSSERCMRPTSSMATAPKAAPSVGVKTPP
jgi:hypothetical protein